MRTSEGIGEIAKALVSFQGNMSNLDKNKTGNTGNRDYKYIDLADVIAAIRVPLAQNGLSFYQSVISEGERVGVVTLLLHVSGQFIESDPLYLPTGKQTAQAAGSAISYAKRYSLMASLGLAARDEDDDGRQASQNAQQGRQQSRQQSRHQQPPSWQQNERERQGERSAAFQVDNKITDKQMKALKTSLNMQAKKNGEDMERIWQIAAKSCDIAGKSTKELSRQEASRVLDFLNGPRKTEQR